jgi:hypothetical protein
MITNPSIKEVLRDSQTAKNLEGRAVVWSGITMSPPNRPGLTHTYTIIAVMVSGNGHASIIPLLGARTDVCISHIQFCRSPKAKTRLWKPRGRSLPNEIGSMQLQVYDANPAQSIFINLVNYGIKSGFFGNCRTNSAAMPVPHPPVCRQTVSPIGNTKNCVDIIPLQYRVIALPTFLHPPL